MNKIQTAEMICLLDKSGSMYGKETDTIESYNHMLKKQKELPGEAYITTVLFSDRLEILNLHTPVQNVEELTDKEYFTEGNTALFDAIGKVLTQADRIISQYSESSTPRVLVFIITDGAENASRDYSLPAVRSLLQKKQDAGWEILFFGTDLDILKTAQSIGIKKEHTFPYSMDSSGIRTSYQTAGLYFSRLRRKTE